MRSIAIIMMYFFGYTLAVSQHSEPSYSIHNDTVVYEFNPQQIDSLFALPYSIVQDFDSLKLLTCIKEKKVKADLSDQWNFHYLSSGRVQIRKVLDDFKDEYSYIDKFLVLPDYWEYPRSELDSSVLEQEEPYSVDPNGNTVFFVKGYKDKDRMILAGSFNQWDEEELEMVKENEGWKLTLQLAPGIYEYKFIADGDWMHDESNPLKLENEHQTYNSILLIGEKVSFTIEPKGKARKVYLAGSFNNWDRNSLPMSKVGSRWQLDLQLPPGKHYYKFIVDRDWRLDENNELRESDENGRMNSVLLVN